MMRSLIAVLIVFSMFISMAGCSADTTNAPETDTSSATSASDEKQKETQVASDEEQTGEPGKTGIYDPPIKVRTFLNSLDPTIKFTGTDSPEDNVWTRAIRDELGIELEFMWTANGEQGTEKTNLAIASNDLPDIFPVNMTQFEQLINADLLASLSEAYEAEAGTFMKDVMTRPGSDTALQACSRNGNLLALPYFLNATDDTKNIWVRYDWLKKVGMDEPKTYQDLIAIAEAFQKEDFDGNGKDDTLLFAIDSGSLAGQGASFATFFNTFHAYPNIWVKGDNGALVNGTVQAEPMKRALSELARLYQSGMLDKAFASLKYEDNTLPAINDNRVGVLFGNLWDGWWPLGEMKNVDPECEWRSYPVLSADEKPASAQSHSVLFMRQNVVRKGFEHPEALIRMANLCNDKLWLSDSETFAIYGYDAAGNNPWLLTPIYFEYPGKNMSLYQKTVKALDTGDTSELNGEDMLIYGWMKDYRDNNDLTRWGIWLSYGPDSACSKMEYYLNNDLYKLNEFYGNPTPAMLEYNTGLEKLFMESALSIITGQKTVDQYDVFIQEWNEQGGEKMTKEVNDWYSSMK